MAEIIRRRMRFNSAGAFPDSAELIVYNTETTGALHSALSTAFGGRYVCSEYFGEGHSPGEDVDGRRHENLQALSFVDGSFDLVLSSDVLEHMPDPYRAHSEIFRVLKPGGRHLFTVPFDHSAALDDRRAKLVDGEVVYLAEKLFHGDPVRPEEGILVWTIFGLEMLVRMAEIGFKPTVWNLFEPNRGIIGPHSIVFEALKPSP
jgi:SAM-dependent methyltransferase